MELIEKLYIKRLESLEARIEKFLNEVKKDDLFCTLSQDPASAKYMGIRLKELLQKDLLKEKEDQIKTLIIENASWRNKFFLNVNFLVGKIKDLKFILNNIWSEVENLKKIAVCEPTNIFVEIKKKYNNEFGNLQQNYLNDLREMKDKLKQKFKEKTRNIILSRIQKEEDIWNKCEGVFQAIILGNDCQKSIKLIMDEWDEFRIGRKRFIKEK